MRIPVYPARTLSGLDVFLPRDFTGDRNVVLIAVERSHLIAFRAWYVVLAGPLKAGRSGGFYALFPVGRVSPFMQSLAAWALRLEIQIQFEREHIALVGESADVWCQAAGVERPRVPLVCVADRHGEVYASALGNPEPDKTRRLAMALRP